MDPSPKRLIVVGDRVLVTPEEGEERTRVGLYLPQTAIDALAVQGGRIIATGPGTPLAEPASLDDEPVFIDQAGVFAGARWVGEVLFQAPNPGTQLRQGWKCAEDEFKQRLAKSRRDLLIGYRDPKGALADDPTARRLQISRDQSKQR